MFGTCIAVFDGYGRALKKSVELLKPKYSDYKNLYNLNVIILILGSFAIIWQFENTNNFGILVNFATALSFVVAPVVAIFNYTIIKKHLDKKYQPPKWLNYLSILGIFYLIIFTLFYLFQNYIF